MIQASWSNKSSVIGLVYRTPADSLFAYPVESPWRSPHQTATTMPFGVALAPSMRLQGGLSSTFGGAETS